MENQTYYGKFNAELAKQDVDIVRAHYNEDANKEWSRFDGGARVEFELNKRFLARYIKPGDRVLDCGGGPGRYSLWLSEMGCDVTLFDLAEENVKFGLAKADELGLKLSGIAGDARKVRELVDGEFDHVLLMGPLYHLTDEADRRMTVNSCMDCLKVGGTLSTAFISFYGGMVFLLRELIGGESTAPEGENSEKVASFQGGRQAATLELIDVDLGQIERREAFHGDGFTRAYMCFQDEAVRFMDSFDNLEKLHFIGSESVLAPFIHNVMSADNDVYRRLLDFGERLAERDELLSYAEHFLYIGRKLR